jgi:hypothetical protein
MLWCDVVMRWCSSASCFTFKEQRILTITVFLKAQSGIFTMAISMNDIHVTANRVPLCWQLPVSYPFDS